MMNEFEDRRPASPLSRGNRALVAIIAVLTVLGYGISLFSLARLIWEWLK